MKINGIEIKVCDNIRWLYRTAYREITGLISKNPQCTIGFATGGTMLPLYEIMAKEFPNKKISYANVTTFNLDEYIGLAPDNCNSYHYFMQKNLFDHLDLMVSKINLLNGLASNLEEEAKRYDSLLDAKTIDLQLLGIGANGHIAFNEPGCDPTARTHVVALNKKTLVDNARFFANDITKVPPQAITMGISDILKAKRIILIATGKNKANAISQMLYGQINPLCPASLLRNHGNCCLYLDNDAARLLKLI